MFRIEINSLAVFHFLFFTSIHWLPCFLRFLLSIEYNCSTQYLFYAQKRERRWAKHIWHHWKVEAKYLSKTIIVATWYWYFRSSLVLSLCAGIFVDPFLYRNSFLRHSNCECCKWIVLMKILMIFLNISWLWSEFICWNVWMRMKCRSNQQP